VTETVPKERDSRAYAGQTNCRAAMTSLYWPGCSPQMMTVITASPEPSHDQPGHTCDQDCWIIMQNFHRLLDTVCWFLSKPRAPVCPRKGGPKCNLASSWDEPCHSFHFQHYPSMYLTYWDKWQDLHVESWHWRYSLKLGFQQDHPKKYSSHENQNVPSNNKDISRVTW
jgi:hypothetical protein